jgi:YegS/Rv2252/BmrU family lipid kinase
VSSLLVIVNPDAGGARKDPGLLTRIRAHPVLAGAQVVLTSDSREVRDLAARARRKGKEEVMVAGGDGTVHHAINGLLGSGDPPGSTPDRPLPTLSVLPLGTANDFARSLGLSPDPLEVLKQRNPDRTRKLDVIRVEGAGDRWCVNVVTGGMAGKEELAPEAEAKESWGMLAYLRKGVEALEGDLPVYEITLSLEGGEVLTVRAHTLVLGNGRYAGGAIPVTPSALLDDGLLDLLLVPELEPSEMAVLTPLLLLGRHTDHDALPFRRTRRVKLQAHPPLDLSLDGEMARAQEATFRVSPEALRVLVGEDPDRAFRE